MKTILAIGLGGGLGAILRHFMNTGVSTLVKGPFPWGIMTINILGSLIIGALVALFAAHGNPSPETRAFLIVGVLGGFTTFSSFSLDTMMLWTSGDTKGAMFYVLGSVFLSIAAIFAGSAFVWKFIA